jgi:hypothetical protein
MAVGTLQAITPKRPPTGTIWPRIFFGGLTWLTASIMGSLHPHDGLFYPPQPFLGVLAFGESRRRPRWRPWPPPAPVDQQTAFRRPSVCSARRSWRMLARSSAARTSGSANFLSLVEVVSEMEDERLLRAVLPRLSVQLQDGRMQCSENHGRRAWDAHAEPWSERGFDRPRGALAGLQSFMTG